MNVDRFMTQDVRSCRSSDNLRDAAMVMWDRDCGFVPVTEEPDGPLAGVITDRDICMAVATKGRSIDTIPVGEVMSREPVTCAPTDDVRVAMERMASAQVRRLPVVGKKGQLKGVVSLNDLVLAAEENEMRRKASVSNSDVVRTLKSVSAHRVPTAVAS
jgi:CBS domain-containing protein